MTNAGFQSATVVPAAGESGGSPVSMLRRAAPTLLLFTAVRLVVLVVFVVAAVLQGREPVRILGNWDGQWYGRIAEDGYGFARPRPDGRVYEDYAFFPLYPALERLASWVTGLPVVHAGLLISAVASLVAAWGVFAVADRLYGARTATIAVVLWAALPVAIVSSMAYTESLFTALAAWALWCVVTRHWVAAGLLAAAAGATRPSGTAVVLAVVVPALWLLLRRGEGRPGPQERIRALTAVMVAPVGLLGYVAWVGYRKGSPTGYLEVAERWGNGADGGRAFVSWTWGFLVGGQILVALGLVAGVALVLTLLWLAVRQRQPLPLLTYTLVLVVLALTTDGFFGSKPRYLFPAFTLLFPVASALAGSPRRATLVGVVMLAVSAVYGTVWLLGTGPP